MGNFCFLKSRVGNLDDAFNLEVAVKKVSVGDTDVEFAIGEGSDTAENRLNQLIEHLRTSGEGELVCYRKIKW